jgi:hypothetical protein
MRNTASETNTYRKKERKKDRPTDRHTHTHTSKQTNKQKTQNTASKHWFLLHRPIQ